MLAKLFLAACFALLPTCISAEEIWHIGDEVAAFFVCKKETSVMDLAMADSKSREVFAGKIMEKKFNQECIKIFPPMKFKVQEILGSYKDHEQVETTILQINSPLNKELTGYILARGKPGSKKVGSY